MKKVAWGMAFYMTKHLSFYDTGENALTKTKYFY